MKRYRKESGEIMLEGMIVMVITMFLLIWILGVGFIYYQRYLVTATTNDAAKKIAATYNNPDSDIILGYIDSENLSDRDLYRNFNNNSLHEVNESKAQTYVTYMLEKTNFYGTVEDVDIAMKVVQDSALRKHIEIRTECTFNTPFGQALDLFGMDGRVTYESTGRADCTDVIDYISTVDFASYQLGGSGVSGKITKMINSLIKIFNHTYTKS